MTGRNKNGPMITGPQDVIELSSDEETSKLVRSARKTRKLKNDPVKDLHDVSSNAQSSFGTIVTSRSLTTCSVNLLFEGRSFTYPRRKSDT